MTLLQIIHKLFIILKIKIDFLTTRLNTWKNNFKYLDEYNQNNDAERGIIDDVI